MKLKPRALAQLHLWKLHDVLCCSLCFTLIQVPSEARVMWECRKTDWDLSKLPLGLSFSDIDATYHFWRGLRYAIWGRGNASGKNPSELNVSWIWDLHSGGKILPSGKHPRGKKRPGGSQWANTEVSPFLLSHFLMKESYTNPFLNVTALAALISASVRRDVVKPCLLSPPWLYHSTTADWGWSHGIKPGLLSSLPRYVAWSLEGNFPLIHLSLSLSTNWVWECLAAGSTAWQNTIISPPLAKQF